MKNMIRILTLVLILPLMAMGQSYTELTWEDLIPEGAEYEDPFADFTEIQKYDLSVLARFHTLKQQQPGMLTEEILADLEEIEKRLVEEGIDVNGILSRKDEIQEKKRQAFEAVNTSLDGLSTSMWGYILPLDYSGEKSTEMLLVPWVGACVHTPPPPKNQIVYIKMEEGYKVRSRFEAVVIEGTMLLEERTQSLYLGDGTRMIDTGYSMDASKIEPYKKTS